MPKRNRTFTEELRQLIDDNEVTWYQVGKDTGIDHAVLSRFRNRKGGLSMQNLDTIAEYFGWTITAEPQVKKKRKK